MNTFFKITAIGCSTIGLLLSAGCDGGNGDALVPVSGTVLFEGTPLESGTIVTTSDRGLPARATIGSDGSFSLSTPNRGEGATVGEHQVAIFAFENTEELETNPEAMGKLVIPRRYSEAATSGLTIEVAPPAMLNVRLDISE